MGGPLADEFGRSSSGAVLEDIDETGSRAFVGCFSQGLDAKTAHKRNKLN